MVAYFADDGNDLGRRARQRSGDGPGRREIAASALLHGAVLLGILALPWAAREDLTLVAVTLSFENGAAGAAGGSAGGGGDKGESAEARSSASATRSLSEGQSEAPAVQERRIEEASPTPPAAAGLSAAAQPATTPPLAAAVPPEEAGMLPPQSSASPEPAATAPPAPRPRAKPAPPRPAAPPVWATTPAAPHEAPRGAGNPQVAAAPAPSPGSAASTTAGSGPGGAAGAGRGTEGTGQGVLGGGEGPGDDYPERIRRWLTKFKHYPEDAARRKQQGTVVVDFVLARDGTVLNAEIERSSGVPSIDAAALDMFRDGSPVPPVPPAYPGDRFVWSMPFTFTLGFFEKLF